MVPSFPPPSNKHNVTPNRTLPSNHTGAPDNYIHSNAYPPYPPPADGISNPTHHVYLPPPKPNVPSQPGPSYQSTTQYPYHQPYANNTSTYDSGSYPSTNDLPATAAAASAYIHNYPPQPPPPTQPYLNPNAPNYNAYHAPGSPTSWRNWAGNMASTLEVRFESPPLPFPYLILPNPPLYQTKANTNIQPFCFKQPGADYMNSASALMQLGGRSEGGPAPPDLQQQPGVAMHQGAAAGGGGAGAGAGTMDGNNGQQMWPFMNL